MPFISSFDPRRSLLPNSGGLGSNSSYTSPSLMSNRGLDRSSTSRKSGVFERPSMYSSSSNSDSITSKYRPSTLERLKNGSETSIKTTSNLPQPATSPTSYSSSYKGSSPIFLRSENNSLPMGSTRNFKYETPVPSYQRTDSLPNSRDSSTFEIQSQSYKSHQNGLAEPQSPSLFTHIQPDSPSSSQTSKPKFSNGGSLAASELTKRISNTLAKHGIEETTNKRNSYVDTYASLGSNGKENGSYKANNNGDYLSNSLGWRRKLDEDTSNVVIERKTVITRATSPQPDVSKQVRTRIAKNTDPEVVEKRKIRNPRCYDIASQTDPHRDFQPMAEYLAQIREERAAAARLKHLTSPSFDYFAHVKKSMALSDFETKQSRISATPNFDLEDEDYYKTEKAPLMALLPGARCSSEVILPVKKASYQSIDSAKSDEESEYTYDDEEYEEEEELEPELPSNHTAEVTYETQAEIVLEDQNGSKDVSPDLDYIDGEEDEAGLPVVTSPKRKRKGAFISGTVDIDILLGKDTTPTSLVTFGASPPNASDEIKPFFEFALPKMSQDALEDLPWWLKINSNGKEIIKDSKLESPKVSGSPVSKGDLISNSNPDVGLNGDDDEEYEEEDEYEEEAEAESGKGEEGDWEWEYYETEGDEKSEDPQEVEEPKESSQKDVSQPWILQGLLNIVPKVPKRSILHSLDNNDNEYMVDSDSKFLNENSELTEREKDYREWLAESEELHRGAHFNLKAEIETEDELEDVGGVRTPIPGQGSECKKEGSPMKLSKAAKLVEKIQNSSGADLKRVLFSLKTFFQTDKDLVYEFVKEGGLAHLVDLGQDDEAQLQNLVLRSLGQLMLYVDGMNGVMENPKAIQFLYNLIASGSRNALVCKTAVKLLLVFVEYTEKNCTLFVQAINATDKELEVIPWTNLMDVLKRGTSQKPSNMVDKELAMYSLTLINKSLYGIPSQDMFFDQTDYLDQLGMEDVIECVSSLNISENMDEGLLQQVQLYNVSLKQEDGEPVTEDDIKYLDEDATEMGLRTSLRTKSGKEGCVRKSLRYKTSRLADTNFDDSGDMEGISIRDVEMILAKNGLPTSRSTEELNNMKLEGVLEKARSLYIAKIAKGEVYCEPGAESEAQEEDPQPEQLSDDDPELARRVGEEKWNEIVSNFVRPLIIGDYDFSDLQDFEITLLAPPVAKQVLDSSGIPLPPPIPPPAPPPIPPPPMMSAMNQQPSSKWQVLPQKVKKTTKLFWKEVRDQPFPTIWDDMEPAEVDSAMIEYLFESRGKECLSKETKSVVGINTKEIIVLDHKRSNAINIGMTKLPPPRIIKSAVMKMDSATMSREGVEKLLTMLPTEEETVRIQEAQEVQPEIPLGTAEQFLLTLSTINCLEARLRLWSFKMEMEVVEKEVCDPLIDLKTGLDSLQKNATFKTILKILLTIGNFLNGSQCKGFQLDYLEKVPEVKDTVHKHSLLYHMTYWVLETSPNSSDLYSEIGPLTRASRTDFDELSRTLKKMEAECKSAWNYLRIVCHQEANHSNIPNDFETKMSDFLQDAAERILVMDSVHRKIMKRYQEFLKWMGIATHFLNDYKVHNLCKILSEFALEYRTTRERVIETIQKKKAAREKKRQAKKAALLAEAAALEALEHIQLSAPRRQHLPTNLDNVDDEQLRFLLASNNIDITENGTLRRKKKHHRSSREHHRHPKEKDETGVQQEESKKASESYFGEKIERKARRHRSSVLEGTMPLTEENFKNYTSNEMERGLLETLMATSDSSTLKRSKERRRSVKEKRSSKSSGSATHDLLRSRTRENLLPEETFL